MGTCVYCSVDEYRWGGRSQVASLWSLLAGNAKSWWHVPMARLGYNGLPPLKSGKDKFLRDITQNACAHPPQVRCIPRSQQ